MLNPRAVALSTVEVVVAIVAVGLLTTLAVRSWASSREEARATVCMSILQRYGQAFSEYATDYGNVFPYENVGDEGLGHVVWYDALEVYMGPASRTCPSVDSKEDAYQEGYRINSQLGRLSTIPPQPYRGLHSLGSPERTVVLFDARYGGRKLSLKGQLKDADYRHNGSLNVLFADWHVERFSELGLVEASGWLPPKVIWDPDAARPKLMDKRQKASGD